PRGYAGFANGIAKASFRMLSAFIARDSDLGRPQGQLDRSFTIHNDLSSLLLDHGADLGSVLGKKLADGGLKRDGVVDEYWPAEVDQLAEKYGSRTGHIHCQNLGD